VADAVEPLRQAVRLDPKDTDAQYSLGHALMEIGKHEEAILAFKAVLEIDPTYAAAKQGVDYSEAMLKRPR